MNLLQDVLTYERRILKTPSNTSLSDNLLIDYTNRFVQEVQLRMQLFDFKTKYQFQTIPGITDYNMPYYSVQTEPGSQTIASYAVYQGFMDPCYANGIPLNFNTEANAFNNQWTNYGQPFNQVATGDGTTTTFRFTIPYFPAIIGHLDISGVIAASNGNITQDPLFLPNFPLISPANTNINIPSTSFYPSVYITYTNNNGSNAVFADSGIFLDSGTDQDLYGLLMQPGQPPFGNIPLGNNTYSVTQNTINYNSGVVNITFPNAPPAGVPINANCYFFQPGMPRTILFYNNTIKLDPPPNTQYLVELTAYLTPAAFLTTGQALPFGYMAEYFARGAARKLLADTGDVEQFNFYEPLFLEQQTLVWKKSQRQNTSTRTNTIYSDNGNNYNGYGYGQGQI